MRRLIFSFWYLFKPPWDSGIPVPELVRTVSGRPPGRALDLGCGTGTNVLYLAERGWQVTGVDFAPNAIAKARRKLKGRPNATLLTGDVTRLDRLPLAGPFDVALDLGCFHALPESRRSAYASGLGQVVAPGGTYLLYAWQPDPATGRGGLAREEVAAIFANTFQLTGFEQGQGRPSAWYFFERLARGQAG